MNEEGYLRDLGKTIPSIEGKWDQNKEYERLSVVYTEEEEEDDSGGGDSEGGGSSGSGDNSGNNPTPSPTPGPDPGPSPEPTPTPVDEYVTIQINNNQGANITIDGENISRKQVLVGTNHTVILTKQGYYDKVIDITNIQEDYIANITFTDADKKKFTITVNTNISNFNLSVLDENNIDVERIDAHQIEVEYGQSIKIGVNAYDGVYGRFQRVHEFVNITENKVINETYNTADQDYVVDAHLTSVDGVNWYYAQAIVLPSNLTNGQWRRLYVRNALNGQKWLKELRSPGLRKSPDTQTDLEFRLVEENGQVYIEYKGTYVSNPSNMWTIGNHSIGHITALMYTQGDTEESAAYNAEVEKYKNKYNVPTISPAGVVFVTAMDFNNDYHPNVLVIPV